MAAKDVIGKTIPKPKRGQLNGWSAGAAGLLTVGVGVLMMIPMPGRIDETFLGFLLISSGLLWLVAAGVYARVPEYPGETGGSRSAADALKQLRLLATDKPFRRFVTTRALLMCSALSAPFYVALAQKSYGSPTYLLGAFIAAAGAASLLAHRYGAVSRMPRAASLWSWRH